MSPAAVAFVVLGLILLRWGARLLLGALNRRHVQANASAVPAAFAGIIDPPTYAKSVAYTLAKHRLAVVENTYDTTLLVLLLYSGVLPLAYDQFSQIIGTTIWASGLFLFAVGVVLSLTGLPLDWYAQFRLEQRFGFNTMTARVWWSDLVKGLLLSFCLGYPLLVFILKLVEWTAGYWWIWAWLSLMAFQLLMAVLAPVLIMPLFNKFRPLPEGSLRDRLQRLAQETGFKARSIQVMDGSKRSRHSNAFFTGFGRFRKIVLFDTLVEQLSASELTAVLAHEIGHYRMRHIHKMLIGSAGFSLLAAYLLALLSKQDWFYRAFGFDPAGGLILALLVFGLLAGVVTFWFSPVAHFWSRRFEYQADAFAARAVGETSSLRGALRKLNEKNLSNLTPHPLYSGFYYSHPTLVERERSLERLNLESRPALHPA